MNKRQRKKNRKRELVEFARRCLPDDQKHVRIRIRFVHGQGTPVRVT